MIKSKVIFRQGRAKSITKACLITEGLQTHGQFQAIGSLLTHFHAVRRFTDVFGKKGRTIGGHRNFSRGWDKTEAPGHLPFHGNWDRISRLPLKNDFGGIIPYLKCAI